MPGRASCAAPGADPGRAPSASASATGAPRMLKMLEEPPPRTHFVLVTDHPADLLPTIRSRCLPVPFRGWASTPTDAALGPFERRAADDRRRPRAGRPGRRGARRPRRSRAIQAQMEARRRATTARRSCEAAAAPRPRRSARAARRAACAPPRSASRTSRSASGGAWSRTAGPRCSTRPPARPGDALAVAVGAEAAVRHPDRLDELRAVGRPERQAFLERAIEEIQQTRSELELNPAATWPPRLSWCASTTPATAPTAAWSAPAAWASEAPVLARYPPPRGPLSGTRCRRSSAGRALHS